jgi:hypothetical protein
MEHAILAVIVPWLSRLYLVNTNLCTNHVDMLNNR